MAGWLTSIDTRGEVPDEKACYTHAFRGAGRIVGVAVPDCPVRAIC